MIINSDPELSIYLINNGHPKIFEIAVKLNAWKSLEILIKNGISVNECGHYAFIDAINNYSYESIKILIKNNYSLSENFSFDELETVSMKYYIYEIIDLILKNGSYDVNKFSKLTLSNLTIYNNFLTFETLVKNGFHVHNYPKELYDYAIEFNFGKKLINILIDNNYIHKMDMISMKNNVLIPFIPVIKNSKLNIEVMKIILTFFIGYNFPKFLVEKFVFYRF